MQILVAIKVNIEIIVLGSRARSPPSPHVQWVRVSVDVGRNTRARVEVGIHRPNGVPPRHRATQNTLACQRQPASTSCDAPPRLSARGATKARMGDGAG